MNIKGKGMAELQQAHCVCDAASRLCRPEEPSGVASDGMRMPTNVKASRFYYRHREEILERRRARREANPEYVERQRQREEERVEVRRRKEAEVMERARLREVEKEERRVKREAEKAAKREAERDAKREEKARRLGAV